MTEKILAALGALHIETYRINERKTGSVELFFIQKNLDMRRVTERHIFEVTVYRDFTADGTPMRGMSAAVLHAGMTEAEVRRALSEAYYAASFVKNPFFALPDPVRAERIVMESRIEGMGLAESAAQMVRALYAADCRPSAFINSAELFVTEEEVRILSSAGTDAAYRRCAVKGEFVVQCKQPQDVEQHKSFSYNDLNTEALTQLAAEALDAVESRAHAVKAPEAGEYDVLLTGEHLVTILADYFVTRAHASMVYQKYSAFETGSGIQGDNVTGERLNLTLKAVAPFSAEGIPMIDRTLCRNGVLECVHGGVRFCRYLGIEPTGDYESIALDNGTVPIDSLRGGRCLEPVSFSDFQMDVFTGHFSGEIRLAFLHEDGKRIPLTGGSINGSILDCRGELVFTAERYETSGYRGPRGVLVKGVRVAGE